jgi:hypothetical protein
MDRAGIELAVDRGVEHVILEQPVHVVDGAVVIARVVIDRGEAARKPFVERGIARGEARLPVR